MCGGCWQVVSYLGTVGLVDHSIAVAKSRSPDLHGEPDLLLKGKGVLSGQKSGLWVAICGHNWSHGFWGPVGEIRQEAALGYTKPLNGFWSSKGSKEDYEGVMDALEMAGDSEWPWILGARLEFRSNASWVVSSGHIHCEYVLLVGVVGPIYIWIQWSQGPRTARLGSAAVPCYAMKERTLFRLANFTLGTLFAGWKLVV